jgi:hypothetical protein
MFARFKSWKAIASFSVTGLLIALPPLSRLLFAGVGMETFVVCPATLLLLSHPALDLNWKFFAIAGPSNAGIYAAFGELLVYLGRKI